MNNIENLRDLIIYQSQNSKNISVEVLYDEENFWLNQKSMAKLFNVEVNTINYHLKEIFKDEELKEEAVIWKIRITANDGKNYNTNFYSLDAIIAVGYRVNSKEATAFRIWATNTLKEYIKKGFVLNDELLKNGPKFGKDYFKELLERIRSIRASERRIWQQITDVFAECSIDYEKNSDITHNFYAMIQNKFHYAITGSTAAIFTMEEFSNSVNAFLEFRKYDILKDNGKISRKQAEEKAENEYNIFNKTQKIVSDFDKLLIEAKRIENKN